MNLLVDTLRNLTDAIADGHDLSDGFYTCIPGQPDKSTLVHGLLALIQFAGDRCVPMSSDAQRAMAWSVAALCDALTLANYLPSTRSETRPTIMREIHAAIIKATAYAWSAHVSR